MLLDKVETRVHSRVNLFVDYGLSFADRLEAAKLDVIDGRITPENFPIIGFNALGRCIRIPRAALLRGRFTSRREMLEASASQNFRQTALEELLAFGAGQFGNLASTTIIALAARCKIEDVEYVACCYYGGFERRLGLIGIDSIDWSISNQAVLVAESEE
jgi:hypothetical protein